MPNKDNILQKIYNFLNLYAQIVISYKIHKPTITKIRSIALIKLMITPIFSIQISFTQSL
jgi:hypothetical protein